MVVFRIVGGVSHGTFCNCGVFAVAVPRTREFVGEKIFLAIDRRCGFGRRVGNFADGGDVTNFQSAINAQII